MEPVGKIKKNMDYSKDLKEIIDILKLVSSSEYSRLFSVVPRENDLGDILTDCIGMLGSNIADTVYFKEKEDLPQLVLLICSDEGFLGEMNARIVNVAIRKSRNKETRFVVMGERGAGLLAEAGKKYVSIPTLDNEVRIKEVKRVANYIMGLYKNEKVGAINVVYMKFKSYTNHVAEMVRIIPCDELVRHISKHEDNGEVIIAPGVESVMGYLVKMWLEDSLFRLFWSSKLSEWATKVIKLENSSDELKNITERLKFKYFKAIHAKSDKVIREIFAAKTIS
ncbi:MAG: F0F1 ATP synthase subunit gamma [Candidatus Omnitrophica bacterium]|nr:F0F1 ATP synthase subunit gamma [Candidatus Omnitrophota bacterium]